MIKINVPRAHSNRKNRIYPVKKLCLLVPKLKSIQIIELKLLLFQMFQSAVSLILEVPAAKSALYLKI